MTTSEQVKQDVKDTAEELEIAQYKAAMLEYLDESKKESAAKKRKEKLKEIIKKALEKRGVRAALTPIPNHKEGKVAVAYNYDQGQPRVRMEVAKTILTADQMAKIFWTEQVHCFTVGTFEEATGEELVQRTNAPQSDVISGTATT